MTTTDLGIKSGNLERIGAPTLPEESRLLVVVPAYNEGPRLETVLRELRSRRPGVDVLVVDDGSSDDTEARALSAGARVARHPFNLGYGAALETGYRFARDRGYGLLVQLDGDGQHDPSFIDMLLAPILEARADVVVGSRFLASSSYRPSWVRRLGSALFGWLASRLTGRRITDPTSGYWAMNRKAVSALVGGALPHDYPDADILIGLHYAGLRLVEVPVHMHSAEGKRSMHAGLRPVYYVFKMLLSIMLTVLGRRPQSV
jgi:glycosyltransferase involved in cell wall biosynthesis